ncbi:hypothetical protein Nepgr_010534 [Nepenthes gracilis]|uniref:Uncharacterized protein n=1 Tax=Nepenthes gracilis TaxID=150966 RepID=A0AAD3SD51_NEPGR|nr:hypothetical protein Nepgr_010534 [Nepenthes gracilis]
MENVWRFSPAVVFMFQVVLNMSRRLSRESMVSGLLISGVVVILRVALFMQDPKSSEARKPWYQRAVVSMAIPWKTIFRSPSTNSSALWKTINSTADIQTANSNRQKLRKCTSLNVAASFTRVCLCAPISSYSEVFNAEKVNPPRRSYSYPRSSKPPLPTAAAATSPVTRERIPSARLSMEGKRRAIFRGKSLTDDVLMRRFVVEEEAIRRRNNQMEFIRRRAAMRRKKLGPSPLRRMVMAEECNDNKTAAQLFY